MLPPRDAAAGRGHFDAVPIGAGAQVDHQRGSESQDDGVDWRQPE